MANIYSVLFDGANDYFDLEDNTAMDLVRSNGNQAYLLWVETDNTGSSKYAFSNGAFGATDSIQVIVRGDSVSNARKVDFWVRSVNLQSPVFDWSLGKYLIVCQYNNTSSKYELSVCIEGGSNVRTIADSTSASDIIGVAWSLGRRGDNASFFSGKIGSIAKVDAYLDDTAIDALASDFLAYSPSSPSFYYPMNEGTGQDITDDVLSLAGTGIGFPTNDSQWIFEGSSSGGISLTATLGTIEYNSNDSVVSLAGSVDVTATLGSINYSSNDTSIQVSGDVNVIATLGAIDYTSNDANISLFGNIDIVSTLGTINYNSSDTGISLTGGINVTATLGVIDYASNDSVITLQGQIPVTTTLGTISYDSYNVTVQIGTGQFIGTVTAGFANDIYSAGFKPSAITVNFKS